MIRAAELRPGDAVELVLPVVGPTHLTVENVYPLDGGRLLISYRRAKGSDIRLSADPDDVLTLVSRSSNTRST